MVMKLLMITQKIDVSDDILGVYHEWAREISKNFAKLSVICLYRGVNELPPTVRVFSLGKEKNESRLQYVWKFFLYIWKLRSEYDVVFVHMTPIYVILGWPLWKFLGKKVFLFYAHYETGFILRVASLLCAKILTSVPGSCGLKSRKVIAIGQGIDTVRFRGDIKEKRQENAVLFVGRISPVKNLDILIEAVRILTLRTRKINLVIVGKKDYGEEDYFHAIKEKIKNYNLNRSVIFVGGIPNIEMPSMYSKYEIYVNLTQAGSFDKAILEAMSCECIPIVSNGLYRSIFPGDLQELLIFKHKDSVDLADKICRIMLAAPDYKHRIGRTMREIVVKRHSLSNLGIRLHKIFLSYK